MKYPFAFVSLRCQTKWDGGNIKYKINSGSWTLLPDAALTFNDYNNSIRISGNDNPMAGEVAFTGSDGRSVSGSWGQSQIDLSSFGPVQW